jgi:hypothetical protein
LDLFFKDSFILSYFAEKRINSHNLIVVIINIMLEEELLEILVNKYLEVRIKLNIIIKGKSYFKRITQFIFLIFTIQIVYMIYQKF